MITTNLNCVPGENQNDAAISLVYYITASVGLIVHKQTNVNVTPIVRLQAKTLLLATFPLPYQIT